MSCWYHPPTPIPTSTPFVPFPLPLFPAQHISPPAPHRRPPPPPSYRPRRHRSRHIRMREPAQQGLFTVSEAEEEESDSRSMYNIACSARASSELLVPSPAHRTLDLPRDVDMDMSLSDDEEEMPVRYCALRDAWCAALESKLDMPLPVPEVERSVTTPTSTPSIDSEGAATPMMDEMDEMDDPFFVDVPLDVIGLDEDESRVPSSTSYAAFLSRLPMPRNAPRRPPPLNLGSASTLACGLGLGTDIKLNKDITISRWTQDVDVATPRSRSHSHKASLLPALPIVSATEYNARRSSSRSPRTPRSPTPSSRRPRPSLSALDTSYTTMPDTVDPAFALRSLLGACGDSDSDNDSDTSVSSSSTSSFSSSPTRLRISFPLPPPRYTTALSPSLSSASTTTSFASDTLLTPSTPHLLYPSHSLAPAHGLVNESSRAPRTPRTPRTPRRSPTSPSFSSHPYAYTQATTSTTSHLVCPDAPGPKARRVLVNESLYAPPPASLKGDHSALFALSGNVSCLVGTGSRSSSGTGSTGSSGSSGSGKSRKLPPRPRLPSMWTR